MLATLRLRTLSLTLPLLLAGAAPGAEPAKAVFKAGFAERDITPEIGSDIVSRPSSFLFFGPPVGLVVGSTMSTDPLK